MIRCLTELHASDELYRGYWEWVYLDKKPIPDEGAPDHPPSTFNAQKNAAPTPEISSSFRFQVSGFFGLGS
jgi:hypothetical protein